MKKPTPPSDYRMLVEGQDITSAQDLIWMIDSKHEVQRWGHAIMQTDDGLKLASDTNQQYVEPKNIEDYCFFRCRKMGLER